jgi:ankyrin repeat protein
MAKVVRVDKNQFMRPRNREEEKEVYLHYLAKFSDAKSVQYLLTHECDVDKQNYAKNTVLHVAVKYGRVELIKALIEKEANLEILNNDNYTPLLLAVRYNKEDAVELLINAGAKHNKHSILCYAVEKLASRVLFKLAFMGFDVNEGNDEGDTQLHIAIRKRNKTMIPILLHLGADINRENKCYDSPLKMTYITFYSDIQPLLQQ